MIVQPYRLPYPLSVNRYWTISARTRSIIWTTEGKKWKASASAALREQGAREPLGGPVVVDICLNPKTRKNGSESAVRIDLDNALKVVLDAGNGVLWHDDRQIVDLRVRLGEPVTDGGVTIYAVPAQQTVSP